MDDLTEMLRTLSGAVEDVERIHRLRAQIDAAEKAERAVDNERARLATIESVRRDLAGVPES